MVDWTLDYILAVLEEKDWSANRLAEEAGVAASTINRPLRERENYKYKISRQTIQKIYEASKVDPAPYIPSGLAEDKSIFSAPPPKTLAARSLENLPPASQGLTDDHAAQPSGSQQVNEIKIATAGQFAHVVATVDRAGITRLRKALDGLEKILDD